MEDVNWAQWKFYLDLAQVLATVALFIWVYITRGQNANAEALKTTNDKVNAHDKRLSVLESRVSVLPTKDDLHQIDRQLAQVSAQLKGVSEQMSRFEVKQNLLLENELRGKG